MIGGKDFLSYNTFIGNQGGTYIIPLNFWFNNEIGSAIPYTALQYSDIEIKIKFKDFEKLWITDDGNPPPGTFKVENVHLGIEQIYLDTKERKEFATQSHEYLIKQVQSSLNNNILANEKIRTFDLNFNHPVIELLLIKNSTVSQISSDRTGFFNRVDFICFLK